MKIKPSGYRTAAESARPGYLAKRFAAIRAEQKAAREAQERADAEAKVKTTPLRRKA